MAIFLCLLFYVVTILGFIVAGIIMVIKGRKNGNIILLGTCPLLFMGAAILTFLCIGTFIAFDAGDKLLVTVAEALDKAVENSEEKILERIEENADEITFYLDGNKVEYENIDLDLYEYTYNEEKQTVYMTK